MRKKIVRDTKQRRAIIKAFKDAARPLSPMEVLGAASKRIPNLGIATVYRNIKALCEEEKLVAVDLPGIATCYHEPLDKEPVYFICKKRKRVYHLENSFMGLKHKLPKGFKMDEFRLIYYGVVDSDGR